MFCVIQEVQRKKSDPNGYHRKLVVESLEISGRQKYIYHFAGERFERPIRTAYKVSIHESKRVGGVVTKGQYAVTTVGYYDLAEWEVAMCISDGKLESIAAALNVPIEYLWDLLYDKMLPLQERIKREFEETAEHQTRTRHEEILQAYQRRKKAFSTRWEVSPDTYDFCYNVFGEVMNQAYLDEIKAASQQRAQARSSYRKSGSSNYSSYDYAKLFGSSGADRSTEDKAMLKKFYRSLSKIYHPDMNLDTDTHAEMVLLNNLKDEWGI